REGEGGKDNIEEPDPEIAEPPPQCRKFPLPSRPAEFPGRHQEHTAEDTDEAQQTQLAPRQWVALPTTMLCGSPSPLKMGTLATIRAKPVTRRRWWHPCRSQGRLRQQS